MAEDVRLRPRLTSKQAAALAKRLYRLEGVLTELPSERDQNFLVRTSIGEQYVLKVADRAAECQVLECQNVVMAALRAEGIPCLHVLPTVDGQTLGGH